VSTSLPATTYAFAAAAGLTMYPAVTRISKQRGARSVLRAGFAIRATAVLAVAFLSGIGGAPLARAGFVVLVMAWPFLGVSGTALTAQLAPGEKGEALGLFNACSSLAGAVGAFVGGWAMDLVGYGALCMAGAVVVGVAALLSGGENTHVAAPLVR
jgi:predicted MFS family arabinose efflux permease